MKTSCSLTAGQQVKAHSRVHTHTPTLTRPHSLLAAASEDPADVHRQTAEVTAVQTHPHGPVAQFTQSQSHGTEVQQTTTETHTHTHTEIILMDL